MYHVQTSGLQATSCGPEQRYSTDVFEEFPGDPAVWCSVAGRRGSWHQVTASRNHHILPQRNAPETAAGRFCKTHRNQNDTPRHSNSKPDNLYQLFHPCTPNHNTATLPSKPLPKARLLYDCCMTLARYLPAIAPRATRRGAPRATGGTHPHLGW